MHTLDKLTKGQRRRRNARLKREESRWFRETIGPLPSYLSAGHVAPNIFPRDPSQLTPEERAPSHVVDWSEEPTINDDIMSALRQRSAQSRRRELLTVIGELKLKHCKYWGQRSRAKLIASLETENGNPISVRTVQRYFKLVP